LNAARLAACGKRSRSRSVDDDRKVDNERLFLPNEQPARPRWPAGGKDGLSRHALDEFKL
jgi:hypothetical protein